MECLVVKLEGSVPSAELAAVHGVELLWEEIYLCSQADGDS